METIYKEKIDIVHSKTRQWTNQLELYKEELEVFNKRLTELALKNRKKNVLKNIEVLQNKFIIQRNEVDELEHKIHVIEDNAVYSGKIHIRRISYERTAKFIYVTNAMKQFEHLFRTLKNEFYVFLSKYLSYYIHNDL